MAEGESSSLPARTLEFTPTWALVTVTAFFVLISMTVERSLSSLGHVRSFTTVSLYSLPVILQSITTLDPRTPFDYPTSHCHPLYIHLAANYWKLYVHPSPAGFRQMRLPETNDQKVKGHRLRLPRFCLISEAS